MSVVDQFHRIYYDSPTTWRQTYWLGRPAEKCPLDLWIFQEILYEVKPDVIIETGTYKGGTTLFFASICDLVQQGKVVSIDVHDLPGRPQHPRITYLIGSSTSGEIVEQVRKLIRDGDKVLVDLDSSHRKDHVLNELRTYSQLVTRGSYLIVEDTNLDSLGFGQGPMTAVAEFLRESKDFEVDRSREKFLLTFNPTGYLKRV